VGEGLTPAVGAAVDPAAAATLEAVRTLAARP
jgi:hypothetical protein